MPSRATRLHLGAEIEFMSNTEHPGAIREYYGGQYEINEFHVINDRVDDNLAALYRWSNKLFDFSARDRIYLTRPIQAGGGPVFSGVHLHTQVRGPNRRDQGSDIHEKVEFGNRMSQFVLADVMRYYGVTFRCLASHHLHGAMRESSFRYKQKPRFMPVTYHQRCDTYEIRCIEPQMLYTEDGKNALRSILKRAYSYLSNTNVRIPTKWGSLARELMMLPADITHGNTTHTYRRFIEKMGNAGVTMRFSVVGDGDSVLRVSYEDLMIAARELSITDRTYTLAPERRSSPMPNYGVERRPFETISSWNSRIEIRKRELFTIRYDDVGRPIQPDIIPSLSGEDNARLQYQYREADVEWMQIHRHSEGNPHRRGTAESDLWERTNAPSPPRRIRHDHLLTHELRPGDVWRSRGGHYIVVTRRLGLRSEANIPSDFDSMGTASHDDARELTQHFVTNIAGIEGRPQRLVSEDIPDETVTNDYERRPGDVWRCYSASGARLGFAVVCQNMRLMYFDDYPERSIPIPRRGRMSNETRLTSTYVGSLDDGQPGFPRRNQTPVTYRTNYTLVGDPAQFIPDPIMHRE